MKRIPELDGMRGLAAILIVLFHAFPYGLLFWGWSGVDLFFILSGFLITTIILTQSDSSGFLRSFYLRRVFRIWPVYYLTLGGVLFVNCFSSTGYTTSGLLNHLFFLQNCQRYFDWPIPAFIHPFSPSWSVAVEEQYYLVWPLLLLLLGGRCVPFLAAGFLALSVFGRTTMLPNMPYLLLTRGDGLALGCFLAWMIKSRPFPMKDGAIRWVLNISGAVGSVYAVVYLIRFWRNPIPQWEATCFTGFSLLFFGLVGLCILNTGSPLLAPLRNPVLRWFGTISYAMYLFHLPLMTYAGAILDRIGIHSLVFQSIITWLLIVGLPAASWYLLESPILRWKEKFVRLSPENKVVLEAAPGVG